MFKREALYAGKYALRKPTKAAITRAMPIVARDTLKPNKMPVANGEWAITFVSKAAIATPSSPPATDNATASPTNNESTLVRVNPSGFSIATSRVRWRMDIAIVFAATRRIANTTAAQILRINAFTLPSIAMHESWKAFSLSAFVGWAQLRNMPSIECDL